MDHADSSRTPQKPKDYVLGRKDLTEFLTGSATTFVLDSQICSSGYKAGLYSYLLLKI